MSGEKTQLPGTGTTAALIIFGPNTRPCRPTKHPCLRLSRYSNPTTPLFSRDSNPGASRGRDAAAPKRKKHRSRKSDGNVGAVRKPLSRSDQASRGPGLFRTNTQTTATYESDTGRTRGARNGGKQHPSRALQRRSRCFGRGIQCRTPTITGDHS